MSTASYSVKAVISAVDKNFSSTMKSCQGYLSNLKSTITGGIGFGVLSSIGSKTVDTVSDSVSSLIGDLNDASSSWKTFSATMEMNGKAEGEIKSIKKELQQFAQDTIYSSSDMASTFAQLEAVGTKNTTKLVKGFGGLASAASNPTQAMKTLSQQATQMAAKPKVAWEDFKLMVEQTPAGIAAVAKQMGMSTQEMISAVQSGTVATEDFFDAISEVGTNDSFTKMATEYKTVGQAMEGLSETAANVLGPAFDTVSSIGINAINKLIDKVSGIDGDALASKITSFVDKAKGYWDVFKEDVAEVADAFGDAFKAIGSSLSDLNGAFGSSESIDSFASALDVAKNALVKLAGFMEEHADTIAKLIQMLPKLAAGFAAFKVVKAVAPFVGVFAKGIGSLAKIAFKTIGSKLLGLAGNMKTTGTASSTVSGSVMESAKAFLAMGAGVLMIAVGFALLAQSAIALSNAGGGAIAVCFGLIGALAALSVGLMAALKAFALPATQAAGMTTVLLALGACVLMVATGFYIMAQAAIQLAAAGAPAVACMAGMLVAVAALMVIAAALGPALSAGAVGLVAFGAAILMVGAGMYLMASAAVNMSNAGTGAIVALVAMAAVVAGLAVLMAVLCPLFTVGAVGLLAFGAAVLMVGAGALLAAAALAIVAAVLPTIATYGLSGATAIIALGGALIAFAAGAITAGAGAVVLGAGLVVLAAGGVAAAVGIAAFALAMTVGAAGVALMSAALKLVNSSMKSIAKNAKTTQKSLKSMQTSVKAVSSGLDALGNKAKSAIKTLISQFSNAASNAKTSGQQLGNSFSTGVMTGVALATASAQSGVAKVIAVLNTGSASAYSCGVYIGAGLANGMRSQVGAANAAAAQLAAAAEKAIRAKAKIHSPSKVTEKLGAYIGEGFAEGISASARDVRTATMDMIQIPALASVLDVAAQLSGSMDLNDAYNYTSDSEYTINVPVVIDGREAARATAVYTEEELAKREKLSKYMKGYR